MPIHNPAIRPLTHPLKTLNSMIESNLSHCQKTKGGSLYEQISKQHLNLVPTPKIAHSGPKSTKQAGAELGQAKPQSGLRLASVEI